MIQTICIYCASSTQIDPVYFDHACLLGRQLAEAHIRIVNGAGNIGLMGAVSDAALEAGGEVTGVIPRFMVEQGWNHTGLTETIVVNDMHERKQTMARLQMPSLPYRVAMEPSRNCSRSLLGNNLAFILIPLSF